MDQKCSVSAESGGEARVDEFLPRCTIAKSKIDMSFVHFGEPNLLLSFLEIKNNLNVEKLISLALYQTICYSVGPLAYCRWGILRIKGSLVTLTVTPTCIYRLTFSKSKDAPFGFDMKIEETSDLLMMEWVLDQFVRRFIHEHRTIDFQNIVTSVDPLDWTPMNLDFGNCKRENLDQPNLGFLFKTTGEFVILQSKSSMTADTFELESDTPVYIKYNSALLDLDHSRSSNIISILLLASKRNASNAARKPEVANRDRQMGISKNQGYPSAESDLFVKHPYVGILTLDTKHPLAVMKDVGPTLFELLLSQRNSLREKNGSNHVLCEKPFSLKWG